MRKILLLLCAAVVFYTPAKKAFGQSQAVSNGQSTTTITFPTLCNYNWTNSSPSIGLAASGLGDILSFKAINPGTSPIVAHISVTPQNATFAYIGSSVTNTVSVINTLTNKTIATIPVGSGPYGVAISADGAKAYITNSSSGSVSVINTQTNQVINEVTGLTFPTAITLSSDGSKAYITVDGGIIVYDTINNSVTIVSPDPGVGNELTLSKNGDWLYATASNSNDIRVFSTATNIQIINIPAMGASGSVASPDGSKIYVTGGGFNCIYVVDVVSNVVTSTIPLSSDAERITVSPDGSRLYVANEFSATVTIVDAINEAVISVVPVGNSPQGISVTPDGKFVYVANDGSANLSVISTATNTVVDTVPCGDYPHAIGNFITPATNNCTGNPIDFTITVNPSPTGIQPGAVEVGISACVGSLSTTTLQFTVSGNNLSNNITATAPAGFQVSLSAASGFANSITIARANGAVINKIVYVRAAVSGIAGNISGNVVLSTPGAANETVPVKGVINDLPTANTITSQTVTNGDATTAVKFAGTGNTFKWTNNKPAIGLAASGIGDIPSFTAINTGSTPVKATVKVTPFSDGYLYLGGNNSVIPVDADIGQQTGNIPAGNLTAGIAVSPDGTQVYVANINSNTISVISTATNTVLSTISVGPSPLGVCFSPDGKRAYVTHITTSSVSVINTSTASVITTVHVGNYPYGIGASPDGKTIYTANTQASTVTAINTADNTVKATIPISFGPTGIVVSPDNSRVYVTSAQYKGHLGVIDVATNSLITKIPVGDVSAGVCISPDGSRVYVVNSRSDNLMIINTASNTVIKTINVGHNPMGASLNTDGSLLYVVNEYSNTVSVINTATNSVDNTISVNQSLSICFGNFFAAGTGCTGTPVEFNITVNPQPPAVTATAATGNILACEGQPSVNTQQFTVSGDNLLGDIIATAPAGFEVSLNSASGFTNSVTITPAGGAVIKKVVYVRAAASATTGNISGNVVLSAAGTTDKLVAVNGVIDALPIVNKPSNQIIDNGATTNTVNFTGTGSTFTWTNDAPGIGLAASGTGNIPSFTAINNGQSLVTATITILPASATCTGNPVTFSITVNPSPPTLTLGSVTGNISACTGSVSASPNIQQFSAAGNHLTADMHIAAPANFEVSLDPVNGYATVLMLSPNGGNIGGTLIYVRSSANAPVSNISGNVVLSSTGATDQLVAVSGSINALPAVNKPSNQIIGNGAPINAVNFTGTGSSFTWTNDTPGIGLAANGVGDIPSFTAINNGQSAVTATITVLPASAKCTGDPVTFSITVNPSPPALTAGSVTGNISACVGASSTSPAIQQFSVGGDHLTADMHIGSPANFEISLDPGNGYGTMLMLSPNGGNISSTIIYVRSSANAPVGNISGNIVLSSTGAANKLVAVSGIISALPVVNAPSNQTIDNGTPTNAVNLTGTGSAYTWTNDAPGIGLPASGTGNIPSFTAINNGQSAVTATITVLPASATCAGNLVTFSITVNPSLPVITTTGNLSALTTVYGSPSLSGSFTVAATNLISGVVIRPPAGFEVSMDNSNFNTTATAGGAGTLPATTVYIRLAKTTHVGSYAGNVGLTTGNITVNTAMPASTVTPTPLVITAENKSRPVHSENPPLTIIYSGFVNDDNEASLVTAPVIATTATMASDAGTYPIFFAGNAASPDYSFTYFTGVLTVTSVTAGVVVPNAFTPNGDGVNDKWTIKYIENYPNCTIDIFHRWGGKVFSSVGYGVQWDGRSKGTDLPPGTYYYIINLKNGLSPMAGWVAILK
jgi:gliding motility-associated-like protein